MMLASDSNIGGGLILVGLLAAGAGIATLLMPADPTRTELARLEARLAVQEESERHVIDRRKQVIQALAVSGLPQVSEELRQLARSVDRSEAKSEDHQLWQTRYHELEANLDERRTELEQRLRSRGETFTSDETSPEILFQHYAESCRQRAAMGARSPPDRFARRGPSVTVS